MYKKNDVWGIKLSDLESMAFWKYMDNPEIQAPNTMTEVERITLLKNFLINFNSTNKQQLNP